jgi:leucyl/phenylalanyl-tRNA--protein transferase
MPAIVWLTAEDPPDCFPPVERALSEPDGLLAAGGDLSQERLLAAYRRGIFPWYSPGQPILWWSPDPRAVLDPREFKRSRSLDKSIRNRGFETRLDSQFESVMRACGSSALRPQGSWISPAMIAAYTRLHAAGYAHSVETWRDGQLVGGLYGVVFGRIFCGESMFSRERDASKVALARLCEELLARDYVLIDCQMTTPHLLSLGARTVPRADYLARLAAACAWPDQPEAWG